MRDEPMQLTKKAVATSRPDDTDGAPDLSSANVSSRSLAGLAFKATAITVVALGLANCSTAPRNQGKTAAAKVDPKYGVKPSPRVVQNGKVPKGGGRSMVGKPYVVAGKTFVPAEKEDYVAVGTASWYGSAFHGRRTANGEVFDKNSFVAAHPTLPLPSYVRVTNLSNKRSMVVRVNDRGPFHGRRLIDLSKGAAVALGFQAQGTAKVKVEYVGRASLAGSDDRKLLATLNTTAPATIPAMAPAPAAAPIMVASAEPAAVASPEPATPVLPAPVETQAAVPVTAPAPFQMEPATEQAAAPAAVPTMLPPAVPAQEPVRIASLQAPVSASAYAPAQPHQAHASPLSQLVSQTVDMPLPPVRPFEFSGAAKDLMSDRAGGRAANGHVVASLPYTDRETAGEANVYLQPMALSELKPQQFITFKDNR